MPRHSSNSSPVDEPKVTPDRMLIPGDCVMVLRPDGDGFHFLSFDVVGDVDEEVQHTMQTVVHGVKNLLSNKPHVLWQEAMYAFEDKHQWPIHKREEAPPLHPLTATVGEA